MRGKPFCAAFCDGWYYNRVRFAMNRELKNMCDRYGIKFAVTQVEMRDPSSLEDAHPSEEPAAEELEP